MKKRILYVITKSNFGGAQRYVFELATAMQARGHTVAVAAGGRGLLMNRLQEHGVKTYDIVNFQRDINFFKELSSLTELKEIITDFQPDVVHLNSSKAGGTGALLARMLRVRNIIFTAHGWPFKEPRDLLWRLFAWSASYMTTMLASKVIVVSDDDRQRASMPLMQHKFYVIKPAVTEILFKDKQTARKQLYDETTIARHEADLWLVTTAELTRNKNLSAAIDAVAAYNQSNPQKVFYTIMGTGELAQQLEKRIGSKGASEHIRLLGYIPDGRDYLKAFDLFVLPSFKEGLPYALLEAAMAKLPVIASNVGGIPEVITSGKLGRLIDTPDATSIERALRELADSSELRTSLGTRIREKVNAEFNLESMLDTTEMLYF